MDLTSYVADFKLLSKQLQNHGKIMFIYDYFIVDDISFYPRKLFMNHHLKMYNFLFLASAEKTDR